MMLEILAKGIDLSQWANTNLAKDKLPELIRRLCFATAKDPLRIEFASGEGTALHGYDGVVEAAGSDTFVPAGQSVWELSAEQGHRAKALKDFEKRTEKPDPFRADETTYVACTLRPWDNKEDTLDEWGKKGWAGVRLYDCYSVETWLQQAPAVHLWISRLLGKQPVEAWDTESYWQNWSRCSNPVMPPEAVTAGYDEEAKQLLTSLGRGAGVTKVRAESADFARAFVAAVLTSTTGETVERVTSRTVIVSSPAAWREITSVHRGLVLIPEFDAGELIGAAIAGDHHVVQALGQEHRAEQDSILLRQRPPEVLRTALEQAWPRADEVTSVAERMSRGFSAFRRSISLASSIPEWAKPGQAEIVLPALMAASWDESFESDRRILEAFSGLSYEDWLRQLRPLLNVSDAPLRKAGTRYALVDRRDSWAALSHRLDDAHLLSFEKIAIEHLSSADPTWDPDQAVSRKARMMPDRSGASADIKSGIADTLALLGALGEGVNSGGARHAGAVASEIVWRLFQAEGNGHALASMSPFFSKIAEASPEQFLDGIEGRLAHSPDAVASLFQDKDNDFFSSWSPHTYLLWSLEMLAWDRTLLSRAATLLVRLASLDPGGSTANRPSASLREIFLPWSPGTAASLEERLQVLDRLRKRSAPVSWSLQLSLLPSGHEVSHPTSEASYRPWGSLWTERPTWPDVQRSAAEVSRRLLEDVGEDVSRWGELVGNFPRLHPEVHDRFFTQLRALGPEQEDVDREKLWNDLRELITRHSKFPDADWSLPPEMLQRLGAAQEELRPKDPRVKWLWLFERWVDLPEERVDFAHGEKRLAELRRDAVSEILGDHEYANFLSVASEVAEPGIWGQAVGQDRRLHDETLFLEEHLSSVQEPYALAARGYVLGRAASSGKELIDRLWDQRPNLPQYEAGLLRCMDLDSLTLERAANASAEGRAMFWHELAQGGGLFVGPDLLSPVVKALLEHDGYGVAIQTLSHARGDNPAIDPLLILDTFERALASPDAANLPWGHLSYDIGELLGRLENVREDLEPRVLVLELIFAKALTREGTPAISQRVLAKDPETYLQLVKAVFKDEDGNPPSYAEGEVRLPPENSYDILRSLRMIPGQSDDDVNYEALSAWASKAVELAAASRRTRVFFSMFGQWLARGPAGSDGAWPHESVRELVEELENEELENAMQVGIANLRGVYSKAQGEGGDQERALAAKYRAWQVACATSWPRTARVLGGVASSYESQAVREDRDR